MKIYEEKHLRDFDFWSGAVLNRNMLSDEELDYIEELLEEDYPNGLSATEVNDIMWFEDNWLAEVCGYESYEEMFRERYTGKE